MKTGAADDAPCIIISNGCNAALDGCPCLDTRGGGLRYLYAQVLPQLRQQALRVRPSPAAFLPIEFRSRIWPSPRGEANWAGSRKTRGPTLVETPDRQQVRQTLLRRASSSARRLTLILNAATLFFLGACGHSDCLALHLLTARRAHCATCGLPLPERLRSSSSRLRDSDHGKRRGHSARPLSACAIQHRLAVCGATGGLAGNMRRGGGCRGRSVIVRLGAETADRCASSRSALPCRFTVSTSNRLAAAMREALAHKRLAPRAASARGSWSTERSSYRHQMFYRQSCAVFSTFKLQNSSIRIL